MLKWWSTFRVSNIKTAVIMWWRIICNCHQTCFLSSTGDGRQQPLNSCKLFGSNLVLQDTKSCNSGYTMDYNNCLVPMLSSLVRLLSSVVPKLGHTLSTVPKSNCQNVFLMTQLTDWSTDVPATGTCTCDWHMYLRLTHVPATDTCTCDWHSTCDWHMYLTVNFERLIYLTSFNDWLAD